MDIFSATIYGVIQGLTEFLPVSSSGHLALLPHLLHITDPGINFDLAMHVGTMSSILCYFHKDVRSLIWEYFRFISFKEGGRKQNFALYFLFSTFVTASFAFLLKDFAQLYGRNPIFIGANLIVFGLIMWLADAHFPQNDLVMNQRKQWPKAFWIGFCQTLALFPGVSRSGITLTVSRAMGLSREESTRYSFLLSAPLILGGFLLKLPPMLRGEENFDLSICLFGLSISFLVGLFSIHFFLKLIRKIGLLPFFIYRLLLGTLILLTL